MYECEACLPKADHWSCLPAVLRACTTWQEASPHCDALQTQWGTHSLTKAILLLMETALEEPLNQRFVLLSESDIPLYPPAVVWLQLTSEHKSRIHSCGDHFVSFLCPLPHCYANLAYRTAGTLSDICIHANFLMSVEPPVLKYERVSSKPHL